MKRALFALVFAVATLIPAAAAHAQVRVAVGVAPVAVYATPCPGPGYIWAPGYYSGAFFIPGRWVYRSYYHPYYRPYAHAYAHYDHPYYGRR